MNAGLNRFNYYDLVCFDLDGILVDTAPEIAEAVNRSLQSQGLARRPVAEITLLNFGGDSLPHKTPYDSVLQRDKGTP